MFVLAIANVVVISKNTIKSKKMSEQKLQIREIGTIGERINSLVNYFCKGNKTAFGRAADVQSGVLAGIVGGRGSKPGFELLQKFLTAYPSVEPNWLLFGHGPMLKHDAQPAYTVDTLPTRPTTVQYTGKFYRDRPLKSTTPLADYKQEAHVVNEWVTFLAWLATLGIPVISRDNQSDYIKHAVDRIGHAASTVVVEVTEKYAYFEVADSSVTSVLEEGQWIAGRLLTNRAEYVSDKLYTVITPTGIFTRYLSIDEKAGYIMAYTYNPGNPPKRIMAGEILEIWAVVPSQF